MKLFQKSLALLLSLLMLLSVAPLAAFAVPVTPEEVAKGNLIWQQDFESAKKIADAMKSVSSKGLSLTTSVTDSNNKVAQLELSGVATSAYYLVDKGARKATALSTYNLSDDGKSLTGVTATVNSKKYTNISGTINTSRFSSTATDSAGASISDIYIATGALADAFCGVSHAAKTNYFANPAIMNADVEAFVIDMNVYFSEAAKVTKHVTMYISGTKVSDGSAVSVPLIWWESNGSTLSLVKVDRQEYVGDSNGAAMTLGDWHRITLVINKETAQIEYYVDGEYAYTAQNGSTQTGASATINGPINLTAGSLYIQLNRLHEMADLNGVMQLDNVSFYSSTDGLGLTKNLPAWSQDFETATSTSNVFSSVSGCLSLKLTNSATDSTDRVAQVDLKGMAKEAYYLVNYSGKTYGVLSGYTVSADGKTITGGTAKIGSTSYTGVQGTINTTAFSTVAQNASGSNISGVYICTGELADTRCGFGNVARPVYFANSAVKNADVDAFVLEMNLYLPAGAKIGTSLNSHIGGTKASDGSAASLSLFLLTANGKTATLTAYSNYKYVRGGAVTLALGQWNRLTFVIDKNTSELDVYTNGQFAFTATPPTPINGAINLKANSWYFQFNRLGLPSSFAKYFQIDDVAIYTSTVDRGLYMREDFEAYDSKLGTKPALGTAVHDLATYAKDPLNADNVAVKIPFGAEPNSTEILMRMEGAYPAENGYYTVTRNASTNAVEVSGYTVTEDANGTYTITNGTDTYTGLRLGTLQDYYEFWGGDGTVNQNWKMNHFAADYATHKLVTLSARYYISTDACGKFIGQLHSYKNNGTDTSFLTLYTVNAELGTIGIGDAAVSYNVLKKGEWNTVMVSINMENGDVALYVNGAVITSGSLGVTNLTINPNSWSFCKILRKNYAHYGKAAGYVMVDDIQVNCAKTPYISLDTNGLLYVEIDGTKVHDASDLYLPYGTDYNAVYFDLSDYEGMITTEDKNSIRIATASGLRYATLVDVAQLDALYALLDEGFLADVSFGTLIAPTDFISTEFTMEAFDLEGLAYLPVAADRGEYFNFDEDPATTHFVGSIVNFYAENITRNFSGRGYVSVTFHNGQVMTVYSAYTQSANVKDVAIKVLEKDYTWTATQKYVLERFAAGEQPPLSDRAQQIQDLAGLNVLAIGDSHFKGSDTQWLTLLAQQSHWNLTNLGMSGWTVAYNPGAYPAGERVRNSMYKYLYENSAYVYGSASYYNYGDTAGKTAEDVDLIFFDGGWNDFMWGIPLGAVDSTDGSTLQGARNLIIQRLLEIYPNAQIILISEWDVDSVRADGEHRVDFVSDGLKALYNANYAGKYNDRVKLIDAGDPAVSGVEMTNKEWRDIYAPDGVHINEEGMKIFASNILYHVWKTYFNK